MNLMANPSFNDQIDRLLNEAVQKVGPHVSNWVPPCNVWEEGDRFCLALALPGWTIQEVTLEMENGTLTVKGTRQADHDDPRAKRKYFVREIVADNFVRTFKLPATIQWDKVQASLTDGMLTMIIPKNEKAQPRRIPIQ